MVVEVVLHEDLVMANGKMEDTYQDLPTLALSVSSLVLQMILLSSRLVLTFLITMIFR